MKALDKAAELAEQHGGWLPAAAVRGLGVDSDGEVEVLLRRLVPIAANYARPATSGFRVGAVGQGSSGAIYLGANCEFARSPLSQTVHAEQAVVTQALLHGERGLLRLAVSAPPCGHCRQFLYELESAARLTVLVLGQAGTSLTDFLPGAFGPKDLGVSGGLLATEPNPVDCVVASPAAEMALEAARIAYAPYTGSYAGVGLVTREGRGFRGPYVENAAFNPSLPPVQAALLAAFFAGATADDLVGAALVQPTGSRVDHEPSTRWILEHVAPGLRLEVCRAVSRPGR